MRFSIGQFFHEEIIVLLDFANGIPLKTESESEKIIYKSYIGTGDLFTISIHYFFIIHFSLKVFLQWSTRIEL